MILTFSRSPSTCQTFRIAVAYAALESNIRAVKKPSDVFGEDDDRYRDKTVDKIHDEKYRAANVNLSRQQLIVQ